MLPTTLAWTIDAGVAEGDRSWEVGRDILASAHPVGTDIALEVGPHPYDDLDTFQELEAHTDDTVRHRVDRLRPKMDSLGQNVVAGGRGARRSVRSSVLLQLLPQRRPPLLPCLSWPGKRKGKLTRLVKSSEFSICMEKNLTFGLGAASAAPVAADCPAAAA